MELILMNILKTDLLKNIKKYLFLQPDELRINQEPTQRPNLTGGQNQVNTPEEAEDNMGKKIEIYNLVNIILEKVRDGLKYLHEIKRLVHLDLHTGNILVNETNNSNPDIKIIDFGLSHYLKIKKVYYNTDIVILENWENI